MMMISLVGRRKLLRVGRRYLLRTVNMKWTSTQSQGLYRHLYYFMSNAPITHMSQRTGREAGPSGKGINQTTKYSTENALFLTEVDPLTNIDSVKSAFSAFEHRYWATAGLLDYDLKSPDLTFAEAWDSRAWLCPKDDLARGVQCGPTQVSLKNGEWIITPASFSVPECHVLPTEEKCALHTAQASWRSQ